MNTEEKKYLCEVHGLLSESETIVDTKAINPWDAIRRKPGEDIRMIDADHAITANHRRCRKCGKSAQQV